MVYCKFVGLRVQKCPFCASGTRSPSLELSTLRRAGPCWQYLESACTSQPSCCGILPKMYVQDRTGFSFYFYHGDPQLGYFYPFTEVPPPPVLGLHAADCTGGARKAIHPRLQQIRRRGRCLTFRISLGFFAAHVPA